MAAVDRALRSHWVWLACALIVSVGFGLGPLAPIAQAHALLIGATPAAGARLARGPAQIELFFSETLEPALSTIDVVDATGRSVTLDTARVDASDAGRLTVSVRALTDGAYTVRWRVVSVTDGHASDGAYAFSVGLVDAPAAPATTTRVSVLEVAARGLRLLAVMALLGGSVGIWWLVGPSQRSLRRAQLQWGLVLFWPAHLLFWLVAAAAAGGQGAVLVAPWDVSARQWLIDTHTGTLWLGESILALLCGPALRLSLRGRGSWLTMALAAGLSAALSSSGHGASNEDGIGLPGAVLHGWAAAIWVGGLMILAIEALTVASARRSPQRQADDRRTQLRGMLKTFTPLGLGALAVLALTGTLASLRTVASWAALFGTLYGAVVLGKVVLAGAMALLGLWHARMARGRGGDAARGTLWVEWALGLVAFGGAGLLAALPPAYTQPLGWIQNAQSGSLSIHLEVVPARIGANAFAVSVRENGGLVQDSSDVTLAFSSDSAPTTELQLAAIRPGEYRGQGGALNATGAWTITVTVRRADADETTVTFPVVLEAPRAAATRNVDVNFGLLLILSVALGVASWAAWPAHKPEHAFVSVVRPGLALLVAAGLSWLVLSWMAEPRAAVASEPENPRPATAESIALGRTAFEAQCQPCHGASGAGDGPVGLTLRPAPADLRAHAVVGVHTDGALYLWITQGIPGSQMPAFASVLSDDARWHLVNYIRTLATVVN